MLSENSKELSKTICKHLSLLNKAHEEAVAYKIGV